MSRKRVQIYGLREAIMGVLTEEAKRAAEITKDEVKRVTREAAKELEDTAPRRTGDYARDWKSKVEFESARDIRTRLYNGKHYQLTHLLEYGHVIKNGTGRVYGMTDPIPHVETVEEHAAEKLGNGVKVRLNR